MSSGRASSACLDLLGEQALAADLGQRAVLDAVALRADDDDLDRGIVGQRRVGRGQRRLDHPGLGQGQRRAAGAEAERAGGASWPVLERIGLDIGLA